ncbi:MAG: response regulator [Gemmatimonadota bacterium]|jgi:CheY-like chemotaxis protein
MRRRDPEGLTLLVVDDDADLRLYVRQCVSGAIPSFARVLEAADGVSGLELLAAEPVDMVVCDVVMRRMDGLEMCRRFRLDPRSAGTPILLMTGTDAFEDTLRRARDAGADGVVPKPFNASRLRAAIREAMQARGVAERPP